MKREDEEEEGGGGMAMECPHDWKPAKKRVKALYAKIKEQVEFYFGNSNLDKDRFFKKQIDKSKDGSIALSMLLSFNRVKALTEDVTVLEKALSKSTMLQLSEDKSSVRRITPYSKPKDVDKRTVYVELLPSNVDHDWIKKIFSRCGAVSYISIPRYKSTGDPKSFAFVEFETVEGAKKACLVLNNPPTEREHKPGKFPKHNKSMAQLKKKMSASLDVSDVKECDLSSNEKGKTSRQKRKRKISSCSADGKDAQVGKRQKSDPLCGETLEEDCSKVLTEHQNESVVESAKSEDEEKICVGSGKKRKKRKQRQQSESSGNKSQEDEASDKSRPRSDSFSKLHDCEAGSKSKYRRRAYSCSKLTDSELVDKVTVPKTDPESKPEAGEQADLEKEEEKELAKIGDQSVEEKPETERRAEADLVCKEGKRHKSKRKKENMEGVCSDVENLPKLQKLDDVLEMEGERKDVKRRRHQHRKPKKPYPNLRVISKEEWLQYKTDYLNTQRTNMAVLKKMLMEKAKRQEPTNQPSQARENYEFIPNVIINVKSDLLLNVKELKEKLNPIAKVAYIDLKEVDVQAYIRCRDEGSARTICDSNFSHYKFSLLQGEEEKLYWEKLKADRDAKMNAKHRLKKRGTSKLMDKIEKLNTQNTKVYFDE